MNIVLGFTEPPYPFGNAAARWFYVLFKGLVERGHNVTAFTAYSNESDRLAALELFPAPKYDLRMYPARQKSSLLNKLQTVAEPYSYLFNDDFRRDLKARLDTGFDVLHLEPIWAGWLGKKHIKRSLVHVHYLSSIDLAGPGGKQSMSPLLFGLTVNAERRLLGKYRNIGVLSPRLRDAVAAINPRAHIDVVPLGLDTSLYPFDTAPPPMRRPTVGLIGSFTWHPTLIAAERMFTRLWPEISRRVPEARLQVVGRGANQALARFADTPNVEIHADVPDPVPYFQSTDVMLYAPPAGSGMKVKILESFALGTPVVTNTEGMEGLPAEDGVHAGIADDDAGLIERTIGLLRDADRRHTQRSAARKLIETVCDPETTVSAIEAIHRRIGSA